MSAWSRLRHRVEEAHAAVSAVADRDGHRAAAELREIRALQAMLQEMGDRAVIRGREQGAPFAALGPTKQSAASHLAKAERRMLDRHA